MNTPLLEKLRKVLAMTESPVEAEAQTASEILHRLLTEHNLSIADLEQRGQNVPNVLETAHDLGKAAFNWKLDLAETIAEHYFCHALVSRYRKTVSFVGRPDNVESLKMLYGWVIDQIKRISAEERRKHQDETGEHIDPLRWQVNFGTGIVTRLGRRLAEMREREAQDSKCTALVLHHKTEISDYLESKGDSRIDGKRTKSQQEYDKRWEAQQAEYAKLKKEDPEAYYARFPWERPLTPEEEKAAQKREERNARRRTGRAYRSVSPEEARRLDQADTAHRSGRESAGRVNLQPFIGEGKADKKREALS